MRKAKVLRLEASMNRTYQICSLMTLLRRLRDPPSPYLQVHTEYSLYINIKHTYYTAIGVSRDSALGYSLANSISRCSRRIGI